MGHSVHCGQSDKKPTNHCSDGPFLLTTVALVVLMIKWFGHAYLRTYVHLWSVYGGRLPTLVILAVTRQNWNVKILCAVYCRNLSQSLPFSAVGRYDHSFDVCTYITETSLNTVALGALFCASSPQAEHCTGEGGQQAA